jgi:hypothetical protein
MHIRKTNKWIMHKDIMVVYCGNNQLSSVSWVPKLNPFQVLHPRTHLTVAYYYNTYIYWSVLNSVYFKHAPLPQPNGQAPANQTWLYLSGKLTELYFYCETLLSTFWKWTTLYKLYVYLQNLERPPPSGIKNCTQSPHYLGLHIHGVKLRKNT